MNSTREQALVGLFVLVAVALLIGTVMAVSGTFSKGGIAHSSFFKFAGGITPGATVRYAGVKAGRVTGVNVDPQDSTRVEIKFKVTPGIPVKTDSVAKITALGALDENYVEVSAGTKDAQLAPPGSVINSVETLSIADIGGLIGGLAPVAHDTLESLNQRLGELKITVARVNDVLNDKNRANVSGALVNLNGGLVDIRSMLTEERPKVSTALTNVQAASAKFGPLLDNLETAIKNANETLSNANSLIVANREDIRASVVELHQALANALAVIDQIKGTMTYETVNVDETMDNVRVATDNLKELTERVKRRPSVLIRGETVKERKPGSEN
jgi:phospholipid/cholesterol/gamma-HCH transport system substrate-binding protein